jgi:hypothetical protein
MIIIIMRGENFVAHLDGLRGTPVCRGTPVAHYWLRVFGTQTLNAFSPLLWLVPSADGLQSEFLLNIGVYKTVSVRDLRIILSLNGTPRLHFFLHSTRARARTHKHICAGLMHDRLEVGSRGLLIWIAMRRPLVFTVTANRDVFKHHPTRILTFCGSLDIESENWKTPWSRVCVEKLVVAQPE